MLTRLNGRGDGLLLQKSGVRAAAAPAGGVMRSMLFLVAKRTGYLQRLMWYYAFRKALGRDGRRKAWVALGAQIADTVAIGPGVVMRFPGKVKVGAGSKLGGRVWIDSWGEVTIGSNVLMTGDIDLLSTQHVVDDPNLKGDRRSVTIGDYVWLALKIVVMPGVTIGNYAVIGTGSVVSHDIPDYGIAVGNPARVVKERARIEYTYVPSRTAMPSNQP
jgi:acetyltransferase-like isoleucine patch superfamily enzyme